MNLFTQSCDALPIFCICFASAFHRPGCNQPGGEVLVHQGGNRDIHQSLSRVGAVLSVAPRNAEGNCRLVDGRLHLDNKSAIVLATPGMCSATVGTYMDLAVSIAISLAIRPEPSPSGDILRSIVRADTESLRTVNVDLDFCHHGLHSRIATNMAKASNVCWDLCEPTSHCIILASSSVTSL